MTSASRPNLKWNSDLCKRCQICVALCPSHNLKLDNQEIVEIAKCTRCQICVRYCPEQALFLNANKPDPK